jgi:hypothetical protein
MRFRDVVFKFLVGVALKNWFLTIAAIPNIRIAKNHIKIIPALVAQDPKCAYHGY